MNNNNPLEHLNQLHPLSLLLSSYREQTAELYYGMAGGAGENENSKANEK